MERQKGQQYTTVVSVSSSELARVCSASCKQSFFSPFLRSGQHNWGRVVGSSTFNLTCQNRSISRSSMGKRAADTSYRWQSKTQLVDGIIYTLMCDNATSFFVNVYLSRQCILYPWDTKFFTQLIIEENQKWTMEFTPRGLYSMHSLTFIFHGQSLPFDFDRL